MCTDAYRQALIRDLSSTASSAPALTPAALRRQAAEADREGVVGPLRRRANSGQDDLESRVVAAGKVAESGLAMTLTKDATVVNGEVIDQR
jgi:hypothetical protein